MSHPPRVRPSARADRPSLATRLPGSLLILKTTAARFTDLKARIKAVHSYSVPEIIALPIEMGAEDYLTWLNQETQK